MHFNWILELIMDPQATNFYFLKRNKSSQWTTGKNSLKMLVDFESILPLTNCRDSLELLLHYPAQKMMGDNSLYFNITWNKLLQWLKLLWRIFPILSHLIDIRGGGLAEIFCAPPSCNLLFCPPSLIKFLRCPFPTAKLIFPRPTPYHSSCVEVFQSSYCFGLFFQLISETTWLTSFRYSLQCHSTFNVFFSYLPFSKTLNSSLFPKQW